MKLTEWVRQLVKSGGATHIGSSGGSASLSHFYRQRMDTGLQLGVERFHHRTVLGDAAKAIEIGGGDADAKMSLAARP